MDQLLLLSFLHDKHVLLLAFLLVGAVAGVRLIRPAAVGDPRSRIRLGLNLESAFGLHFLGLGDFCFERVLDCLVHLQLVVESPFGFHGARQALLFQLVEHFLLLMSSSQQRGIKIYVYAAYSCITRHIVVFHGESAQLQLLSRSVGRLEYSLGCTVLRAGHFVQARHRVDVPSACLLLLRRKEWLHFVIVIRLDVVRRNAYLVLSVVRYLLGQIVGMGRLRLRHLGDVVRNSVLLPNVVEAHVFVPLVSVQRT